MADIADLNPVFAGKINDFLTAAQKAGIPSHIISGYRSKDQQAKLYANYQAHRAGQPIPYPQEGSGGVAAPAGGSMHNYGLATDVLANNGHQQDLISFANAHPELGIKSLGAFDPPHFQLAGDQHALMANPPSAPDGFTAPNLTAFLGGAPATTAQASPHLPAFRGTTLNSVPMDPSIAARGGVTSPPGASPVSAPAAPTFAQNLGRGDVGAAIAQLTANKKDAQGNEQPGTSALGKLAGIAEPKQQQSQQPSAPMLQAPEDSTTAIGPAAQQLLAATIAQASKPLHWSTAAPGYGMAGPQVPGTTLNSGAPYV